jgi:hypothetical protein
MVRTISVIVCVLLLPSAPASAALIDLGHGLIYDSEQDLTWMQDTMYSRTSGYDADGRMSLVEAEAWAAGLAFGGYDDWRLPSFVYGAGRMDETSEISRMLVSLGWIADAIAPYEYEATGSAGPFLNFNLLQYWLDDAAGGMVWNAIVVYDVPDGGVGSAQGAWAVRDGGNPYARTPEPSTLLLVAVGATTLAMRRRRSPTS